MTTRPQVNRKIPTPRGGTRPGGRTERVRKAVVSAVLGRLGCDDITFSFQDIANDAGVHVATIYARWPDRSTLVMAAYEEHLRKLAPVVTGTWEKDLYLLGIALRDFLKDPVEVNSSKLLVASGDEKYKEQMTARFTSVSHDLAAPLEDARRRGLIRSNVDTFLVVNMIIGPLLSLIMFAGQIPDDDYVRKLIEHVIFACRLTNE